MGILNIRTNGKEFEKDLEEALTRAIAKKDVNLTTRSDIMNYTKELLIEYKAEEGGEKLPVNDVISLGCVLKDEDTYGKFIDMENYTLPVIVGRDTENKPVIVDLEDNTHILISGVAGSGKSWAVNSLVYNIAMSNHPGDVSFLIMDYKGDPQYRGIANLPHVIGVNSEIYRCNPRGYITQLEEIKKEMNRRMRLVSKLGVSKWEELRNNLKDNPEELRKFPRLFVIIEEMGAAISALEFEGQGLKEEYIGIISEIAKQSRSLGIRLILVSQRPTERDIPSVIAQECGVKMMFRLKDTDLHRVDMEPALPEGTNISEVLRNGKMVFKEEYLAEPIIVKGLGIGVGRDIQIINVFRALAFMWQVRLDDKYFDNTFTELSMLDRRLENRSKALADLEDNEKRFTQPIKLDISKLFEN